RRWRPPTPSAATWARRSSGRAGRWSWRRRSTGRRAAPRWRSTRAGCRVVDSRVGSHTRGDGHMAQLTFVTVCMGRLSFLRQTLGRMVGQPDCATVVVDYSCPEASGDWAEANHPEARVVRVPGRRTLSVTAARNAGAAVADTPWLCFVD